jgi:methionyl aminopeptidase
MITKDPSTIRKLRAGGRILALTLKTISSAAKPGISAFELNRLAEDVIHKHGAKPSFLNYRPSRSMPKFPYSLCVSINDEVVHGLPIQSKILKEGDIVGLDIGVKFEGLFTDAAVTVAVGNISKVKKLLMDTASLSLSESIMRVRPGAKIGDIGHATQSVAEAVGFNVVRDLVGHGVGLAVHEPPDIPCFGRPGTGPVIEEGMVLAIEPMLTAGSYQVELASDQWTVKTADQSPSAHFEHTVIVTKDGCEILTAL